MVRMESTALFVPLEVLRLAFWEGIIILSIFFCGGFGGTGVEVTGGGGGGVQAERSRRRKPGYKNSAACLSDLQFEELF